MLNNAKRDAKRDDKFFEALTEGYGPANAAKMAGYSRSSAYNYRKEDKAFSERWDDSLAEYKETLEAEADRRAHDGVTEGIYYQGKEVGSVQKYSDSLLMFRLKKIDPSYRENFKPDPRDSEDDDPVSVEFVVIDGRKDSES